MNADLISYTMKKHYLFVVGILTWLMMMPPPKMPPVKDSQGNYEVDLRVPVSKWITYATYRNEPACRADLKHMPEYFLCVDSQRLPSLARAFMTSGSKVPKQTLPDSSSK